MKFFDLHCDTALEAYKTEASFYQNSLNIDFLRAFGETNNGVAELKHYINRIDSYTQVLAVFSEYELSDDGAYEQFFKVREYIESKKPFPKDFRFFLAVEGANLLGNDILRLHRIYEAGVRILTLVWKDESCIGGAYNTSSGLTDFGRQTVCECFKLGIVPDVSHASDATFVEVAKLANDAGKPFVATHSNSRTICCHKRNLTDDMFKAVINSGGIVGISLCPNHLKDGGNADIADVIKHIKHYLALEAQMNHVGGICMGCDFDGTPLPRQISGIESIPLIAKTMRESGISADDTERIMWKNAESFFIKNNIKNN